jgi:hypothetical protein
VSDFDGKDKDQSQQNKQIRDSVCRGPGVFRSRYLAHRRASGNGRTVRGGCIRLHFDTGGAESAKESKVE